MKIRDYALATGRSVEYAETETIGKNGANCPNGGAYLYRACTARLEERRSSRANGYFDKQDAFVTERSVEVYVTGDRALISHYRNKRKRDTRGTYEHIAHLKGYGIMKEIERRRRAREIRGAIFEGLASAALGLAVMGGGWLVAIGIDQIFTLMGVA